MSEKDDIIGNDYNATRKADPFLVERLIHHLNPQKGQKFLDIGCGTGNYTIKLHQKGLDFIGIDPSSKMLKIALSKSSDIDWQLGKVEKIPFENNSFDGAIATLTIHHWSNLQIGFNELFRVLKPTGRLVIFTSTPKQMKGYWLNHFFPKMLNDSIIQMPDFETVEQNLLTNRFQNISMEKYFVKSDLQDLFLYAGKHDPKLYLNEKVRQGISSFSSLAHHKEVENGLNQLNKAIDSNTIKSIMEKYQNDEGDYLFVIAHKNTN